MCSGGPAYSTFSSGTTPCQQWWCRPEPHGHLRAWCWLLQGLPLPSLWAALRFGTSCLRALWIARCGTALNSEFLLFTVNKENMLVLVWKLAVLPEIISRNKFPCYQLGQFWFLLIFSIDVFHQNYGITFWTEFSSFEIFCIIKIAQVFLLKQKNHKTYNNINKTKYCRYFFHTHTKKFLVHLVLIQFSPLVGKLSWTWCHTSACTKEETISLEWGISCLQES